MNDYVSREAAVKIAERYGLENGSALGRHAGLADCIARDIAALPAAEVEPVRRWIPCSEELPEKDGRYLVANDAVGVIGVKSFAVTKRFNGRGQERRDVWWYLDDEWADQVATGITHWMPLPEPPEEEECGKTTD